MAIWHVAPLRFAPAFRALGVCEHLGQDIWATILSPKWAEIFVAQMAGDKMSLPQDNLPKIIRRNVPESTFVAF